MLLNKNMLGGLIGAAVLNLIHTVAKRMDPLAPEVDKLGEEALSKAVSAAGLEPPTGSRLVAATLGADIASNAALYSLIGIGGKKHMLARGVLVGAAVGLGTLTIPGKAGLDDTPVKKSRRTEIMTVAWYVLGGLAAAAAIKAMRKG